jgi:uncharacterized protein YqeY
MARDEEAEAAILAEFLPEPLSAEELEAIVRGAVAETGASSPSEMGRVMAAVLPQTRGRADGKLISDLVRRALGAG